MIRMRMFFRRDIGGVLNLWGCASTLQARSVQQHHRLLSLSAVQRTKVSVPCQNIKGTLDEAEVKKFSDISDSWWEEDGEFKALHSLNTLRVPLVRDALTKQEITKPHPLRGIRIADIGCGGGILSEPFARLGAEVVGIDASEKNIAMARSHALLDSSLEGRLSYMCSTVEELPESHFESYDGVIASEIIEHVTNPAMFVSACCNLVKPGGSIFFTSLNKTYLSYALAVVAAERILRVVPAGSHDWNKFLSPDEIQYMLRQNGFDTQLIHGMLLNPLTNRWCWMRDTSMNYALHAVKPLNESTAAS